MANLILTVLSLIAAGAILLWTRATVQALNKQIDRVLDQVRSLAAVVLDCENGTALRSRLDIAGEAASAAPLAGAWRDYRASLVELDEDGPLAATAPASSFFGPELAYRPGLDLRKFDSFPNSLVGAGLLATFLGLALSIFLAQQALSIGSGDLQTQMQEQVGALSGMLSAAAFKFITSIVAVACALWFGSHRNKRYRELDDAMDALSAALDARTRPMTGVAVLDAVRAELARQAVTPGQDADLLADAFADAIDEALPTHLETALKPVTSAIADVGKSLGNQNIEAMKLMAERFAQTLSTAARNHTEQMIGLVSAAGDAMRGAPEAISKASQAFADTLDAESRAFGKRVSEATQGLDASLSAHGRLLEGLREQADSLHRGVAATDAALANRMAAMDVSTQHAGKALQTGLEALAVALGPEGPIRASATSLEVASRDLGDAVRESAGFRTAGVDAAQRLDALSSRIATSIESIDQLFDRAANAIADGLDRVEALERTRAAAPSLPSADELPVARPPSADPPISEPPTAGELVADVQPPSDLVIVEPINALVGCDDAIEDRGRAVDHGGGVDGKLSISGAEPHATPLPKSGDEA